MRALSLFELLKLLLHRGQNRTTHYAVRHEAHCRPHLERMRPVRIRLPPRTPNLVHHMLGEHLGSGREERGGYAAGVCDDAADGEIEGVDVGGCVEEALVCADSAAQLADEGFGSTVWVVAGKWEQGGERADVDEDGGP
jgi:hypothetical protein